MKKLLVIFTALIILSQSLSILPTYASEGNNSVDDALTKTSVQNTGVQSRDTYEQYLSGHKDAKIPDREIKLSAESYSKGEGIEAVLDNYMNNPGKSVHINDTGFIEWQFEVDEEGLYNIEVEYFPVEGKGSSIEREIVINGNTPFYDAKRIIFNRVWKDTSDINRDNRGNDLRPRQIEEPIWQEAFIKDSMGYHTEPYKFYFKKGINTLRLVSVKEPIVIRTVSIEQEKQIPAYEEVLNNYKSMGYSETKSYQETYQGEDAKYKSEPTIYPLNDRSSPSTQPYHKSKIRLNTIGGYRWNQSGQWITWEVDVPEDGLYNIAFKYRQNISRGAYTCRKLYIDDQIPFKEAEQLDFNYSNSWLNYVVGDKEPFFFYLSKGKHSIKLEVTLGDFADLLREAEESVYSLNTAYRKILMITGATPDIYRDYRINEKLPDVIKLFSEESEKLSSISRRIQALTGTKGDKAASLDRFAYQLNDLSKNPDTIHKRMDALKQNIGALSTWILTTSEQPLEIDYLAIYSKNVKLPKAEAGFFAKVLHEFNSFIASFFEDYNSIGNTYEGGKTIKVWATAGRDQANILKEMIDDSFTPETGINVNLQLVQPSVILPSVVAGLGPDVVMQVGNTEPVNYAIRNALTDLSKYSDFDRVSQRFNESALTPFRFNGGVYALPETESFPMLFYRKDIIADLGLQVPQTWEDVLDFIAELQKNNMSFGISPTMSTYAMLLYQKDGELYKDGGKTTIMDSEKSVEAFKEWTDFFIKYKLPIIYDFNNRFRIGEMPAGIVDYSTYNYLSVFAPEIRGLWEFVPVPGLMNEDGKLNRSVPNTGTGTIILESSKFKKEAWEYLKWWTSTEMQVRFGRDMESIMGASARYPTANKEALSRLPWPRKDYESLLEQWRWVKGILQVPGGYFTSRHLDNAFRKTVFQNLDPRETLLDYVKVINEEIHNKRLEFRLETD